MRLNHDCVRAVLLAVEDKPFGKRLMFDELQAAIPKFSKDDIQYCCIELGQAGMIDVYAPTTMYEGTKAEYVREMTMKGHAFLDDIRSDTVWSKVKDKAQSLGAFAISALAPVAAELVVKSMTP